MVRGSLNVLTWEQAYPEMADSLRPLPHGACVIFYTPGRRRGADRTHPPRRARRGGGVWGWRELGIVSPELQDEDFVTLRLPDRFGLIWLRCGNATNAALAAWLEPRWDRIEALLDQGERFIEVR